MGAFNLPRKKIGIAWLKDKHALARQWICFHSNDIAKFGEQQFLRKLQEIVKVIDYGFGATPLNLSTAITNSFRIRLRKNPKNQELKALQQSMNHPKSTKKWFADSDGIKWRNLTQETLEIKLKQLYKEWFLNIYGEQRFWFTHANHRIAQDIIAGKYKHLAQSEKIFKLQSLASRFFNEYCIYRDNKYGKDVLEGDIMTSDPFVKSVDPSKKKGSETVKSEQDIFSSSQEELPTGPIIGDDMRRADPATQSGILEWERKEHFEINDKILGEFKKVKLFWRRRAIRVTPTKSSYTRQGEDLLLQFTLPSGSYASVLIAELLWEVQESAK